MIFVSSSSILSRVASSAKLKKSAPQKGPSLKIVTNLPVFLQLTPLISAPLSLSPPPPPPPLTTELSGEFDLREKEVEWLDKVGRVLLSSAASDSRAHLFNLDGGNNQQEEEEEGSNVDARQRALRRWEQIKDIYDRRLV